MTTDKTTALLPCPFCGGEASIGEHAYGWVAVGCENPGCGTLPAARAMSQKAASVAWNRRAALRVSHPAAPRADADLRTTVAKALDKYYVGDGTRADFNKAVGRIVTALTAQAGGRE